MVKLLLLFMDMEVNGKEGLVRKLKKRDFKSKVVEKYHYTLCHELLN